MQAALAARTAPGVPAGEVPAGKPVLGWPGSRVALVKRVLDGFRLSFWGCWFQIVFLGCWGYGIPPTLFWWL